LNLPRGKKLTWKNATTTFPPMQNFTRDNYRFFFFAEYQRRTNRNLAYSWRAFARDLGLTSSRITEIMKGKAGLSVDKAKTYAEKLHLTDEERELFLDLVEMEHGRNKILKQLAKERILRRELSKKVLSEEEFSFISKWYYLPLLSLLGLSLPNQTPEAMADLLDLSPNQVQEALIQLEAVGLIAQKDGRYVCLVPQATTGRGSPSDSRRQYAKQILKKAERAIDTQALEERSFTSTVMAIDKSQMVLAQNRIRQYCADLTAELEAAPAKNAVYCLSVNFFSMTGPIE
jgi:uncharacterized protein (TIGR02147 family)